MSSLHWSGLYIINVLVGLYVIGGYGGWYKNGFISGDAYTENMQVSFTDEGMYECMCVCVAALGVM